MEKAIFIVRIPPPDGNRTLAQTAFAAADRVALMKELSPHVEGLLRTLPPVDECWQPSQLLPDMGTERWHDEVVALREEASHLTDAMLVVLVGSVVTEEALPNYLAALNRFGGATDATGTDDHPWARWNRAWTAEENRHGDVTRTYLVLSGRVDLRSFEATVQHLLRNGFDTKAGGDPYRGLAYAAFQEHATKLAWNQLGRLAGGVDAPRLRKICGLVAADEARHERAYASVMREVVRCDPVGALEALEETLCRSIVMPARTMTDGKDPSLFAHFAHVGRSIGVYTHADYAENLAQLIDVLGLPALSGLPAGAEEARQAILAHSERHTFLAREMPEPGPSRRSFEWIHGRAV
jgi:acyl-[acyl-carrier-protein] desaturase